MIIVNEPPPRRQQRRNVQPSSAEALQNRQLLQSALENAGKGIVPVTPLHLQPSMRSAMIRFNSNQLNLNLRHCSICSQRKYETLFHNETVCEICAKDLKDNKLRFSIANDMHPMHPPSDAAWLAYLALPPLTVVEQYLLGPHQPVMRVIRLKGGQLGFSGCCVNLLQDIGPMCRKLPRDPSTVAMVTIRRPRSDEASGFKDYRCRRGVLLQWIEFFFEYNPLIRRYITLDMEQLNQLPADGSILHMLPIIDPVPPQEGADREAAIPATQSQQSQENMEGGVQEGPGNEAMLQAVLETGFSHGPQVVQTESQRIQQMCADEIMPWPAQVGLNAVCEYSTPNFLALTYPYIFPFGYGDVTSKMRLHTVTIKDGLEHYARYCYCHPETGRYVYPFAGDGRFMHHLQDMDERQRILSQANVYIQKVSSTPFPTSNPTTHFSSYHPLPMSLSCSPKNPADTAITGAALRNMSSIRNNVEFFTMSKRMITFAANVLGSAAYFSIRKKELTALMEQHKIGTLWYTLSFANYYWLDFLKLFEPLTVRMDNESEVEFDTRWKKESMGKFLTHSVLADEFFYRRTRAFMEDFFGPDGLHAKWNWYRYEYQARGNIHCHGMVRLKSDPGLQDLGSRVYKGRKSELLLGLPKRPEDSYLTTDVLDRELTDRERSELETAVNEGNEAEKCILTYHDFLLTSMHPNPPADATLPARLPYVEQLLSNHPCTNYNISADGSPSLPTVETYCDLCDNCIRHRHSPTYCQAKGSCRFHFLRPVNVSTKICIEEIAWKKGDKSGQIRRVAIKITPATNDSWLSGHCRAAFEAWGANIDFQLLLDAEAVLLYIAKYVTKTEIASEGLESIYSAVVRRAVEADNVCETKVLRQLFQKMTGGRDKTLMETGHLAKSLPMVHCTHDFRTTNLVSTVRKVDTEAEDSDKVVQDNIVDLYPRRLDRGLWLHSSMFVPDLLDPMPLLEFTTKFKRVKNNKIAPHDNSDNVVNMISPQFSSKRSEPNYYKYCLVQLYTHKPFVGHFASTYGGVANSPCPLKETSIDDNMKSQIITAWETFNGGVRDLRERLQEVRGREYQEEAAHDDDGIIDRLERPQFSPDSQPDESDGLEHGIGLIREQDVLGIAWDTTYDFGTPVNDYAPGEFTVGYVSNKWSELKGLGVQLETRKRVDRNQLNEEQGFAHDVIVRIITGVLHTNHRTAIMTGRGGTGKSHTIDCIYTTLHDHYGHSGMKSLLIC